MAQDNFLNYLIKITAQVQDAQKATKALQDVGKSADDLSTKTDQVKIRLNQVTSEFFKLNKATGENELINKTLAKTFLQSSGAIQKVTTDLKNQGVVLSQITTQSRALEERYKSMAAKFSSVSQTNQILPGLANQAQSGTLLGVSSKTGPGISQVTEAYKQADGSITKVTKNLLDNNKVLSVTSGTAKAASEDLSVLTAVQLRLNGQYKDIASNGKLIDTVFSNNAKGAQLITESYRTAGGTIVKVTKDMSDNGKVTKIVSDNTKNLSQNLFDLTKRAALVIPTWLALRAIYTSALGVFSESAKSIVDIDTALKNVELELQGTKNLPEFMERLKQSVTGLSEQTGQGPTKILDTFKQFATAGIDAETSLAGMNEAIKGSVAVNGDAVETGKFLADIYNTLGDRITEVSGAQNKFNYIMATIATLMPTNTFSFKEFTSAAENLVATAKTMNLTLDQTFVLIATSATAMQRGSRAGTQLASAFQQLAIHGQAVRDFLGHSIQGEGQFDVYLEVLKKLSTANQTVTPDLQKIFGLRGLRVTSAEAATFTHVVDELDRLSRLSPDDRAAQLVERFGTATEKIGLQLDRLKQIREELGRIFIGGFVGDGEKFADTLKNINQALLNLKPTVEGVALAIKGLGTALGATQVPGFLGGLLTGVTGQEDQNKVAPGQIAGSFGKAFSPFNVFKAIGLYQEAQDSQNSYTQFDELKSAQARLRIERQRRAAGLPPLAETLRPIVANKSRGELEDPLQILKTDEKILLISNKMQALGFNDIEIQKQKILLLEEQEDKRKALVDLAKLETAEVAKTSQELQNTFDSGLQDLVNKKISLKDFGSNVSNQVRSGILGAFSGNITEQIFKNTGLGNLFGESVFGIRHANDSPIGGSIKGSFDYGADVTYKSIVKGFEDGKSGKSSGILGTAAFSGSFNTNGALGAFNSPFAGGVSLPGFGAGGIFNGAGGNYGVTGGLVGPATRGQSLGLGKALGGGAFALSTGYSAYQSAGGANGSLGIPAGVTGLLGGAALAGSLGAFGAGGAALGGALGLTAFAPLLGPIGIALLAGSLLFSAFSKTKSSSSQSETQEKSLSSKVDISNRQLQLVNRNLVAIKSSLDKTFVLQGSAYYSESQNLSDQFSIASRR